MSLTKATYSMVSGAPFNILDYGASTSASAATNSAAIQAAIDAAFAAGGGEVVIPTGVYDIGTTGLLVKNRVMLVGLGGIAFGNDSSAEAQAGAIIKYTGSSYAVAFGDGTYNCYGGGARNIGLYGNATGVNGIAIKGASGGSSTGVILDNVLVNNFTGNGVECGPYAFIGDMRHVNVRNCNNGFYLVAENNRYNLSGCDANGCDVGFLLGAGSGTTQSGIQLFGGRCENIRVGVQVTAPTAVVGIYGIYIEAFTERGILCNNSAQTVTIIGSTINGSSALGSCIAIFNGGFCTILGNEFTGSVQDEVNLGSAAVYGEVKGNRHGATVTGHRITPPIAGSLIELEKSYTGTGAVHETHTYTAGTFTPTWGNLTVGNATTNTGWYVKVGKQVTVGVHLIFGSTTAITGTGVSVTNLPFTVENRAYGVGNLLDTGTQNYIARSQVTESSTIMLMVAEAIAGSYLAPANLSATVPHTWANTDEIRATCTYTATTN